MSNPRKLHTGKGDYVDASLHRMGCWVMSPYYNDLPKPPVVGDVSTIPEYATAGTVIEPTHSHYKTKSGFLFITDLTEAEETLP